MQLQSLTPADGLDWYLEDRGDEIAESTRRSHKSRLKPFVEWCGHEGIDNLNNITGRDFTRYKNWRRDEYGSPNNVTLNTAMMTLRAFIKWCEKVNAVPRDYHEYIDPPRLAPDEDVRDTTIETDTIAHIRQYLERYHYASRDHIVFELLWTTGARAGAIASLDVDDFKHDGDGAYLSVEHRPDTGTPLKNGRRGERLISLQTAIATLLEEYIENRRRDKTDDYGRRPLITTRQGRIAANTVRSLVYKLTRPCWYGESCPHGHEIDECEGAQDYRVGSKCPSTAHPHAIRKGAITWARLNDIPLEAISERMDVSPKVLKKHYDKRTKEEQMQSRRNYFDGP